jgi:hypothetical protein
MYSKNYLKKIGSVALAGAMAASLSIPALADTQPANSTVVTGAYQDIAIAVTVPESGTAQINPYGLPVKFTKSASSTKAAQVTGEQIVTQPLAIYNEGDVALDVAASVTTTATNDVTISKTAITEKTTGKAIYAYLQMVQSANKTLDEAGKDKIIDEYATSDTWAADGVSKLVLDSAKEASQEKMVTLAASKVTTTTDAQGKETSTVTYNAGSIALYRLAGEVVTKPSDAWTTSDGFTATVAFTFTPSVSEE